MRYNKFIERVKVKGKAHESINEVYHDWLEDIVNDPKRATYPIMVLMPSSSSGGRVSEDHRTIRLTYYLLHKQGGNNEERDSIWSDLEDWSDSIHESIESLEDAIELQSTNIQFDEYQFPDLATSIKVDAVFKYYKGK